MLDKPIMQSKLYIDMLRVAVTATAEIATITKQRLSYRIVLSVALFCRLWRS